MRAILFLALVAAGCGGPSYVAAKDPARPTPKPVQKPIAEAIEEPEDCPAQDPEKGPPPKVYGDRVIELGDALAKQGLDLLLESEERSRGAADNQAKLTAAVGKFHEALAADPYNVKATYNLAAAYARIGRTQCALNLLARLVEMAAFPSQKEAIQDAGDRLLGRGKKWQGRPDPDFEDMRANPKFLDLAKHL